MNQGAKSQERTQMLLARHGDLVRFLSLRLPRKEDAMDLAQEAYLRMIRLNSQHLIENPEAYLFRIASNLISEHWLACQSQLTDQHPDLDALAGDAKSPEALASDAQTLLELGRALENLPDIQKKIVLMNRRDGKTYKEVAAELGISKDMVKKHLCKALLSCRHYLLLKT
ncbi:MAG: RNA polymerase sigma factor [Pseudohongiellaceae bacterium]|jgi:RNA polymerase sigma-70 factor (ECF subfamily)